MIGKNQEAEQADSKAPFFSWELALGSAKVGTVRGARSSLGTVPIFACVLVLGVAEFGRVLGARSSLGTTFAKAQKPPFLLRFPCIS